MILHLSCCKNQSDRRFTATTHIAVDVTGVVLRWPGKPGPICSLYLIASVLYRHARGRNSKQRTSTGLLFLGYSSDVFTDTLRQRWVRMTTAQRAARHLRAKEDSTGEFTILVNIFQP